MGTSLTVHPFAMLAELAEDDCPRVLINLERVGDFASRTDDVLLLGKCDEMVRELCRELGWEEELEELWKTTEDSVEKDEDALDKEEKAKAEAEEEDSADEFKRIRDEVDTLTSAIEHSLAISSEEKSSSSEAADPPKSEGDVLQIPQPKESSTNTPKEVKEAADTTKKDGKL